MNTSYKNLVGSILFTYKYIIFNLYSIFNKATTSEHSGQVFITVPLKIPKIIDIWWKVHWKTRELGKIQLQEMFNYTEQYGNELSLQGEC